MYLKHEVSFPFVHTRCCSSNEDKVSPSNMVVEYEYSKSFLISGGNYIVKDMPKTYLINESLVTQYTLKEISTQWKTFTLLSFGSSVKLLMNGFVS